jgi:hypothetical protein
MSEYFSNFPEQIYNNYLSLDITKRTKFKENTLTDPLLFLPYTVEDGEKPEDIAYYYYGSTEYVWLILLANDIIDPYYDWPMDQQFFYNYLMDKYADISGKTGYDIISWTKNENILSNIVYFYKEEDGRILKVNNKTLVYEYLYDQLGNVLTTENGKYIYTSVKPYEGYIAYRVFDYENDLNENKRQILVIDKQYLSQIEKELKTLMNE